MLSIIVKPFWMNLPVSQFQFRSEWFRCYAQKILFLLTEWSRANARSSNSNAIIAKMNDAFYWVFGFIAIYVRTHVNFNVQQKKINRFAAVVVVVVVAFSVSMFTIAFKFHHAFAHSHKHTLLIDFVHCISKNSISNVWSFRLVFLCPFNRFCSIFGRFSWNSIAIQYRLF